VLSGLYPADVQHMQTASMVASATVSVFAVVASCSQKLKLASGEYKWWHTNQYL